MQIAITGASGFVGQALTQALTQRGHTVLPLTRNDLAHPPSWLQDCDAVVHLAGATIAKRWTKTYKKEILSSRIETANTLFKALQHNPGRVKTWVSASAIGVYGTGFLAEVCQAWEASATQFRGLGIRSVCVRTGLVLGKNGGVLAQLIPPFNWGLGAVMGSGAQWVSWIHLDDLVALYCKAVEDNTLAGPLNACSPNPVQAREFAKTLGQALDRPVLLKVPEWALSLALGESASLLLDSIRVSPDPVLDPTFQFNHPTLLGALKDCLS
ncbi:MAG: TIGR01777 family oxidoreductase [Candidatus Margulisiibacteriota bacterium]